MGINLSVGMYAIFFMYIFIHLSPWLDVKNFYNVFQNTLVLLPSLSNKCIPKIKEMLIYLYQHRHWWSKVLSRGIVLAMALIKINRFE